MSPARKSAVIAAGPVLKMVVRAVPWRKYAHSSAFGCQCMSRRPPGFNVTRVAAIVFDTRKLLLSAIRTVPLFVSRLGGKSARLNTKGFGGLPAAEAIWASTVSSGGAGWLLW